MYINKKIAALVFFGSMFASATIEPLSVSSFASLPDVRSVLISPDGNQLASLVRISVKDQTGTMLLAVNLGTGKQTLLLHTDNKKFIITQIQWANDNKLLVHASFAAHRRGTPTTETRLFIVDINSKDVREAIPRRYLKKFGYTPQFLDEVIDILPDDEDHILMTIDSTSVGEATVYKVSLVKERISSVLAAKSHVESWLTDRQHNVRIGEYHNGTAYKVIHRFPGERKWQNLWEYEVFSEQEVSPMGFGQNPNHLYVTALHEGRDAIFLVDLSTPELKRTLILAHDNYDVNGTLLYSQKNQRVIGVQSGQGYTFWDEAYEEFEDSINRALPDTYNDIQGVSIDENRYVVLATSDTDAGTYYVGNREAGSISSVASRYAHLKPDLMAPKQWITYTARDGLEIEAALTLPLDREKGDKLATIIFPHGGPNSREGDGFDYWTQFFANRGYAVLQMNFRGSSGYGFDFKNAGLKSWGLAMQDDVIDGAHWMVENGYADPARMCIVGASYGGYAALMGAATAQNLFKCAVSFAGVSDLAYLVKSARRYINFSVVREQLGGDYRELKKRSPLHLVEDIATPILLVHGTKDRSVKVEHSQKMHRALVKANKEVIYLELEDGNHYLSKNEHRLATFDAMEAFLKDHLAAENN